MLIIFSLLVLYLSVRLFFYSKTQLIEDTDSLFYLYSIDAYRSMQLDSILSLGPASTPVFPLVGAFFGNFFDSTVTGARVGSLFFSVVLFFSVIGIGRLFASTTAVLSTLLIAALSTVLVSNSFSILTEPTYIGTVYFGLWVYLRSVNKPHLIHAFLTAVIFSLAFLNRSEGIMYIIVIPLMQCLHFVFNRMNTYSIRTLVKWALIYVITFSAIIAPQIWKVSDSMGSLSLNGRQAHMLLLKDPAHKSNNEAFFSLDYDPSTLNIDYLQNNISEYVEKPDTESGIAEVAKRLVKKSVDFYYSALSQILGPLGIICLAFGVLHLFEQRKGVLLILLSVFAASGIAPDLLTPQVLPTVVIRHILVVVPILFLVSGIGLVVLSGKISAFVDSRYISKKVALFALLLVWAGFSSANLAKELVEIKDANDEYSPAEIIQPIAVLANDAKMHSIKNPLVVGQREYFSYFSNSRHLYMPFTDYSGLIEFLSQNGASYLYLKHSRVADYPFFPIFETNSYGSDLELIYSGEDASGELIELFAIHGL